MNATFTLSFDQISAADLLHVGGKGANATHTIQTGQRLRLNGDLGYVEILNEETKALGDSADQK